MDDICPYGKILYIEDGIEEIAEVDSIYAELLGFKDATFVLVRLPDTIRTIGDYAFGSCGQLRIVLFDRAQDETVIGEFAFAGTDLKQIDIPLGVTKIGYGAFCSSSLKKVTLPDSLKEMGEYVFENCSKLEKVTLSKQLDVLPQGTFMGCSELKQLSNADNLKYILPEALTNTEIQENDISDKNMCFLAYDSVIRNKDGSYLGENWDSYIDDETYNEESTIYNIDVENRYLSEMKGIPLEVLEEPVDSDRIWIDGKYYTMSMSLEEILQNDSWETKDSESNEIELYNKRTGNQLRIKMDSQGIEELHTNYGKNKCVIVLPGGVTNHSLGWIRAFMLFDAYEDAYEEGTDIPNSYDIALDGRRYHVSMSMNGILEGSIRISIE